VVPGGAMVVSVEVVVGHDVVSEGPVTGGGLLVDGGGGGGAMTEDVLVVV